MLRSQSQRPQRMIQFYEIFTTGKSIKTESRSVGFRAERYGRTGGC